MLGELGGGEGVAAIERGLRDLAGKVMANPDVQNLGDSIRTGALKVSPEDIAWLIGINHLVFSAVGLPGTDVSGAMIPSIPGMRLEKLMAVNTILR